MRQRLTGRFSVLSLLDFQIPHGLFGQSGSANLRPVPWLRYRFFRPKFHIIDRGLWFCRSFFMLSAPQAKQLDECLRHQFEVEVLGQYRVQFQYLRSAQQVFPDQFCH